MFTKRAMTSSTPDAPGGLATLMQYEGSALYPELWPKDCFGEPCLGLKPGHLCLLVALIDTGHDHVAYVVSVDGRSGWKRTDAFAAR